MSFRGGSRGGFRGSDRGGRGGGFSRGGGRGGGFQSSYGPPAQVLEIGTFMHPSEGDMVCESTNAKIPFFNAPIYLENKTQIGKIDEILGPINQVYFTIKPQDGIQSTSFKSGDKFFIGGDKLLPLERFLPKPKVPGAGKVRKTGQQGRGDSRGGRGAPRGGRGAPRGGRGGSFGGRGGSFGGGRGAPRGGRGGSFGGRGGGRGAPRGRGRGY